MEKENKQNSNLIPDPKMLLPTSILVSTLILSFTLLIVGGQVSNDFGKLSTAISNIQFKAELGAGSNGTLPSTVPSPSPTPSPVLPAKLEIQEFVDDDLSIGEENAPVTIIEFSDFQCPFCKRFRDQTFDQIKSEYIDTGKVRFVYRDFPISFHPYAQKAAEAAECARGEGKFWEMHDKIFENQDAMDVPDLKKYAVEFGLDQTKFDQCLDSGKYGQEVKDDFSAGSAAGVGGTPSFIIGKSNGQGQMLVGAQPFENFKTVIEAALSE